MSEFIVGGTPIPDPVERFLLDSKLPRLAVLRLANRMYAFEPIEVENTNVFELLRQHGARFAHISWGHGNAEQTGSAQGYYVYGFRGMALVVMETKTADSRRSLVFAVEKAFQEGGWTEGKSITYAPYVRTVRDALEKLFREGKAEFPIIPLRFTLNEYGLRFASSGRIDWWGMPVRAVQEAGRAMVRQRATL